MMLLREQRGWYEQTDLIACLHCDERSPQRDFGFSETHIAADDPIHGLLPQEVLECLLNGCNLIVGFLKRKFQREALIHLLGERESDTPPRSTLGVERQQLRGDVSRLCSCLAPGLEPLIRTEPMEWRLLGRCACVARY